ncbi:MAG: hypothetical protein OXI91_12955 [Chloroflexota bacterium]|nr:hypothetical protein [Chloroflexota bacterium]
MHGRKRTVLVLATVGTIVPGLILAFIFLHILAAGFITLIAAPILLGVLLGGHGHRRANANRLQAQAAQRGDSAFFTDPRRL